MNSFTQLLLKAGPTRLFAMLGIAAVVAALLFTLVFRMGGEAKAGGHRRTGRLSETSLAEPQG